MFREICQFGSRIRSGYFSNLSPVVNAVNGKSASIVILSNTRFSGQTVHTKEVSWPGYKFICQDEAGLLIQYHAKLHVEEVVDREGKLEKNPILWLAVTQGMGQGRVRGERMTLVAWRPSLILLKVKLTLDNLAYPIESKYVCTSLAV